MQANYIKVLLNTLVTKKNVETVYFEKSIPKVHFMQLVSYSL